MDAKLKEHLPQISLGSLSKLDRGRLARQFQRAIFRTLQNISEFPVRGDKAETREIVIRVRLTPEIKFVKRAIETALGQTEGSFPEITGLMINADIKDKLPIFQTDDVRCAIDVVNGDIKDCRFNPDNNINPTQLELFDQEEPAEQPSA
jgi:hypothetical protein